MSIVEKLAALQQAFGDRPITLVAVTKNATPEQMREAYKAGVRVFGENRVQDALEKMAQFQEEAYPGLSWHLIGHLQRNKVGKTLGRFALIHSVDSVELGQEIARRNAESGLTQRVLLQVNISGESTKHGLAPAEVRAAIEALTPLKGISLQGLMTMAPHISDPARLKQVFCDLKTLRDELEETCAISLPDLSMGMSNDFMHAIECGATMVRIGSHLFHITDESA